MLKQASIFLLASLTFAACGTGKAPSELKLPPEDFRLELASGGGFAGRWEGYKVSADGSVANWSAAGDTVFTPLRHLDPAARSSLWSAVQESPLMTSSVNSPGNMSALLRLTANGATHVALWPLGDASTDTLAAFERTYRRCLVLVQSAR